MEGRLLSRRCLPEDQIKNERTALQMTTGDTYTWIPSAFEGRDGIMAAVNRVYSVSGRVVYINEAHRFFMAEAEVNGFKIRECFKF